MCAAMQANKDAPARRRGVWRPRRVCSCSPPAAAPTALWRARLARGAACRARGSAAAARASGPRRRGARQQAGTPASSIRRTGKRAPGGPEKGAQGAPEERKRRCVRACACERVRECSHAPPCAAWLCAAARGREQLRLQLLWRPQRRRRVRQRERRLTRGARRRRRSATRCLPPPRSPGGAARAGCAGTERQRSLVAAAMAAQAAPLSLQPIRHRRLQRDQQRAPRQRQRQLRRARHLQRPQSHAGLVALHAARRRYKARAPRAGRCTPRPAWACRCPW